MEEVKENKKYYFGVFTIVNELLIIKNRSISPVYWLMQARDEMQPPNLLLGSRKVVYYKWQ